MIYTMRKYKIEFWYIEDHEPNKIIDRFICKRYSRATLKKHARSIKANIVDIYDVDTEEKLDIIINP